MNKRGSLLYYWLFYLFLIIVIFFALYGKVVASKDDTGYNLEFYAKDIAYGVEGMLWSDGNVSYVYPLKDRYDIKINNDAGIVFVKKGHSQEKHSFRTRSGFFVNVEPYTGDISGFENPYLISKNERKLQ
ncbi:hypothetical protein HOM13_00295 [Candidatus Woesearchaeota archaeon]|jgi:hypothetical protein|nr:hypothetical protein [Candidatus Woesearchaeota archaeon]MBT5215158.1 hypothetical protein [Candidatus Woesearchaeota archaeon]